MNPPCTGDVTTCGKQFNRSVACYQVPPDIKFGQNWTTQPGVTNVSMSYCPDVASTPAYDVSTGESVARGTDGKLVVTTVCPTCNFVSGVQPWQMNTCPCFGAGDYCNITSGTTGVCQKNNNIMCTSTQCPSTNVASSVPTDYFRANVHARAQSRSRVDKAASKAAEKARKASVKAATKARKDASKPVSSKVIKSVRPLSMRSDAGAPAPCNIIKCQKACQPNMGSCSKEGCKCLGSMAPSYALPSSLSTTWY